jgi:hypothetical protein
MGLKGLLHYPSSLEICFEDSVLSFTLVVTTSVLRDYIPSLGYYFENGKRPCLWCKWFRGPGDGH